MRAARVSTFRRLVGMLRPLGGSADPMTRRFVPELPPGRAVSLPRRGEVFVRSVITGRADAPVLLLHGWTMSLDTNYFGLMSRLTPHNDWIGFDQRGHAGGLPINGPFSIRDCAEDVRCVLDELGIQRVLVCGFSLGGPVGLTFALAYPDRVAGLALISTSLCAAQSTRDRLFWALIAVSGPLARHDTGFTLSARYFGANRVRGAELHDRWVWLRRELARTPARSAVAMAAALRRCDLRGGVAPLRTVPAAVVLSSEDTLVRLHLQTQLAEELGATVFRVAADHDFPVVHPQLFADNALTAIQHLRDHGAR